MASIESRIVNYLVLIVVVVVVVALDNKAAAQDLPAPVVGRQSFSLTLATLALHLSIDLVAA